MSDPPRDDVRVTFESSGGFAGTTLTTSIDDSATDADRDTVRELLSGVDLDALPARGAGRMHPDQKQYRIAVTVGGRTYRFSYSDEDFPDELRPLLRFLNRRSRHR
jgi:hypothetical protein